MPKLLSRAEALERMKLERPAGPSCLMCAIQQRHAGPVYTLQEDDSIIVSLPRYVRRWGQVLVSPVPHAERFDEVDAELWMRVQRLSLLAARMVERVMSPKRVYVASTGSSAGEIAQSSTHLHVHVIPLYDSEDRPADIFSWQAGVYSAEHDEWESLRESYLPIWRSLTSNEGSVRS